MATSLNIVRQRVVPQIFYSQIRLRHKFKTKRPRQKPIERRIFEAVTAPILPETTSYMMNSCRDPYTRRVEEENPYEEFLIRQLKKVVDTSQMMIICHRMPCSGLRLREVKIDFKLKDLEMHFLNNTHLQLIIKDTEKANLSYLLTGHNIMITSPEIKLAEAWAVLRKTPELVPLGGFCLDRLITKNQLQEFSKLPTIEQLRGELVSCLNLIGGAITLSILNSHQQSLSTNLQQYHKQKSEES